MKRLSILLAVLLTCLSLSAQAETMEAESRIEKATVFSDRALVSRKASINLTPGMHKILFKGLPGQLDANSISAKGEGAAQVKLFGAELETLQLKESQPEEQKRLQNEIQLLQDKKAKLQYEKNALAQKQRFLASIKAASLEQIGKDIVTSMPDVEKVRSFADYIETENKSVSEKSLALDVALRENQKEISRVQRELNQLGWNPRLQEKVIAVHLEAETAGSFDLEISYQVYGAGWHPLYEARANVEANQVQLIQYGSVWQNTGEDWTDATLELSTAKPSLGGKMPEIQPWYLRESRPRPLMARKTSNFLSRAPATLAMEDMVLEESFDAEAVPMEVRSEARVAQATVESSGASVNYTLAKKYTVETNGEPHKVSIASYDFTAGFRYYTTPRLAQSAYLTANVINELDGILLAGEVSLFQKGSFIGTSSIDLIGPGETFELYLGVDERVKVEWKRLKAKEGETRFPRVLGKNKEIDFSYLTTIENFTPSGIDITLFDQIPVAQNEKIKISDVTAEPEWNEAVEDKPGVHKWFFRVGENSKKDLKLTYTVSYPKDFNIDGVNL